MKEEFIKEILKELRKDLHKKEQIDFIGKLLEERADSLNRQIMKDAEYKKRVDAILKIEDEIKEKFKNYKEVMQAISKHEEVVEESQYIERNLMYKHGLHDGVTFMLEALQQIDNKKAIEEDK